MKRSPRVLSNPQSNNHTTGLCGISATYKINKKRSTIKRPCYCIYIAPSSVVSRCYNDKNKDLKLKEAILIRQNAVLNWPNYTSRNARTLSDRINHEIRI